MKAFTWYAVWWYQHIFGVFIKKNICQNVLYITWNRPSSVAGADKDLWTLLGHRICMGPLFWIKWWPLGHYWKVVLQLYLFRVTCRHPRLSLWVRETFRMCMFRVRWRIQGARVLWDLDVCNKCWTQTMLWCHKPAKRRNQALLGYTIVWRVLWDKQTEI